MQKLKRPALRQRLESTLMRLSGFGERLLSRLGQSLGSLTTAVLIVLCLLMFISLSGCAPRTVRPTLPPQAEPRPVPQFSGRTYRDVILHAVELREAALACEADKAVIRRVYGHE